MPSCPTRIYGHKLLLKHSVDITNDHRGNILDWIDKDRMNNWMAEYEHKALYESLHLFIQKAMLSRVVVKPVAHGNCYVLLLKENKQCSW